MFVFYLKSFFSQSEELYEERTKIEEQKNECEKKLDGCSTDDQREGLVAYPEGGGLGSSPPTMFRNYCKFICLPPLAGAKKRLALPSNFFWRRH